MSIYLNLLEQAVAQRDKVRVYSRICNLLMEGAGLTGVEIYQKTMEIAEKFSESKITFFEVHIDSIVCATDTSEHALRSESANLKVNFSEQRLKHACDLRDTFLAKQKKTEPTPGKISTQASYSPHKDVPYVSHCGGHKIPKDQHTRRTQGCRVICKNDKTVLQVICGISIGGVSGVIIGLCIEHIVASILIGSAVGGTVSYVLTQTKKN